MPTNRRRMLRVPQRRIPELLDERYLDELSADHFLGERLTDAEEQIVTKHNRRVSREWLKTQGEALAVLRGEYADQSASANAAMAREDADGQYALFFGDR